MRTHFSPESTDFHPPIPPAVPVQVADLLLTYLEQLGVEYLFGIPGQAIEPLYSALARSERRGGIRHVLARHEAGAAFMADGYARESGKLGVCCAGSDPGATNLITGVSCAYSNNIPLLVITGQSALRAPGQSILQESADTGINTLGMFLHCTRYNSLVSHPKQFEEKLVAALQRATRTPYGPVHLDIPLDIFRHASPNAVPAYNLAALLRPAALVDEDALASLLDLLFQARNTVLLIGGGCGEAIGSILQFATLCGMAFVSSPDGKGLVSAHHPLYRGVFGFCGHASAEAALRDPSVDLILAVGASMGEWNTGGWSDSLLNERLVHIDESEDYLARTPMAKLHVRGRICALFKCLIERMHGAQWQNKFAAQANYETHAGAQVLLAAPQAYRSDAMPIKPQRLMRELGRLFPPSTRYLADTGDSVAWAIHYLHPVIDRRLSERRLGGGERKQIPGRRHTYGGWLRVTMHFAPMGWAIGSAIGTATANRGVPVVCISGDGSMLMNAQEISVAVAEKLCVIFVVLNDRALGMVKHGQRLAGAEQIACALPATDFAMLARALGVQGLTIRSAQDLLDLDIAAICARRGPTLLDVLIDAEEVPPMGSRIRVLADIE